VPERNLEMAARIESAPVRYPFSFVVAGDSGAWPDPTAEAIYAQLLRQTAALEPVFFANLGDFAGPGTRERHEEYLRGVEALPVPDLCVIGNHDLDDPSGPEAWAEIHGPRNFDFAYGHTRFVVLDAAPGRVGELAVEEPSRTRSCSCTARRLSTGTSRPTPSGASTSASPSSSRSCPSTRWRSCAARTRSCSTTTSTTGRTS
jgi:hypothetical protein